MPCFKDAPSMDIGKDLIDLSKDADILRTEVVRVRGLGRMSKKLWRKRRVTLVENALLIQHPERRTPSQTPIKRIPLKSITNLERVDLTPACLLIELANGRKCYFSFENDAVLYDWQDDIYPRSRLGNFSHPFNFTHEVHLTTNDFYRNTSRLSALRNRMQPPRRKSSIVTSHRTSSELSHQLTFRQPLSPQRASYDSCAKAASSHRRTNSASSTSTCRFLFDSSTRPTGSLKSSSPSVLLEGLYQVKRWGCRTLFAFWRSCYVVLTSRTLQIRKSQVRLSIQLLEGLILMTNYLTSLSSMISLHGLPKTCVHLTSCDHHRIHPCGVYDGIHQSSHPEVTIQLPHITDVSQLKLKSRPFVLRLATSDNRRLHISLPNTSDLQRWRHFIATRSRPAHISDPEGFEFHVHVSWNSKSQTFSGLPDEWKTSLEVQQIQAKAGEPPSSTTSSPVTPAVESPTKPIGPSCPMCYNNMQCSTCKLDSSFPAASTILPAIWHDFDWRPRKLLSVLMRPGFVA
ncbi:hypothetical protein NP233_g9564 [Leucocoprinus birnbaumii]|uniref:PH domain-containing protein n=1 Tax=Leucocoprinus birnbaumii TaxID=56174 RepID=A0AAD5YSQ9_9AGAR|nr:hypothetical protein NP233_g9564 [Leucocoprinus birnbaumii]